MMRIPMRTDGRFVRRYPTRYEPSITYTNSRYGAGYHARLGPPAGAKSAARPNISSIPKPWQRRVHRSLYVKTPQPVLLDALRLLAGEHGVMAVSVPGEDRVVVAPHPNRVGESSMVGQP